MAPFELAPAALEISSLQQRQREIKVGVGEEGVFLQDRLLDGFWSACPLEGMEFATWKSDPEIQKEGSSHLHWKA